MRRQIKAFTLVELLVVIGIIAVLISVLLPTLGKARQAANLIDCQARMRSMGQAFQMYSISSRGYLPWGYVDRTSFASWTDSSSRFDQTPSNKEPYWYWYFTLAEAMGQKILDSNPGSSTYGLVTNLSPIFRDRDTIDMKDHRFVSHYTVNPRLCYLSNYPDLYPPVPVAPRDRIPRKLSQVKNGSAVFLVWDAPQCADDFCNNNAYPTANALDKFALDSTSSGLCYDSPATVNYGVAALPGIAGASYTQDGKAAQVKFNADLPDFHSWLSHLRFRHMNNTTLSALCVDGHVEVRKAGTVMRTDIYSNRPQ